MSIFRGEPFAGSQPTFLFDSSRGASSSQEGQRGCIPMVGLGTATLNQLVMAAYSEEPWYLEDGEASCPKLALKGPDCADWFSVGACPLLGRAYGRPAACAC